MDDVPRIKPQMRALLECSVQLAPRIPIPHSLLRCMLSSAYADEFPGSIRDLIAIGMFEPSEPQSVLVSPAGYQFMNTRSSTERVRLAVERGLLIHTIPLLNQQDEAGLRAIRDHLWVVTMRALPRLEQMDEEMQLLIRALMDCLTMLKDADGLRQFSRQLDLVHPDRAVASGKGHAADVLLTPAMELMLQCAACLSDTAPFPRVLLSGILDPESEGDRAINNLVEDGLFVADPAGGLRMTAQARKLAGTTNLEAKEAVLNAVINVVSEAVASSDWRRLRAIEPQLRAFTTEFLPRADETACVLTSWLAQCLMHLQDFSDAVYYAEQAERLQQALGFEVGKETSLPVDDQTTQETYRGLQAYTNHDYVGAKAHFETALHSTTNPQILAALYQKLSECYGQLHDVVNQVAACTAALTHAVQCYGMGHPELARFRSDLALLLVEGGLYGEAERQLEEALSDVKTADAPRLLENKAAALLILADLRFKQNHPGEGRQMTKDALAIVRKVPGRWTTRTQLMYFIASMCFKNGQRDLARHIAKQALAACKQIDLSDRTNRDLYNLIKDLRMQLK